MEKDEQAPKGPTTTVPKAGSYFYGLGRAASYEAAKRGDIPTLKVGKKLIVPLVAMYRKLEQCGTEAA